MGKDIKSKGIPRPLVKTNQAVIVISVLLTWLTGQHWILAIPLAMRLVRFTVRIQSRDEGWGKFPQERTLCLCARRLGAAAI